MKGNGSEMGGNQDRQEGCNVQLCQNVLVLHKRMRPCDYWISGFSGIWGMSVIDNGSKHHFWGVGVTKT